MAKRNFKINLIAKYYVNWLRVARIRRNKEKDMLRKIERYPQVINVLI